MQKKKKVVFINFLCERFILQWQNAMLNPDRQLIIMVTSITRHGLFWKTNNGIHKPTGSKKIITWKAISPSPGSLKAIAYTCLFVDWPLFGLNQISKRTTHVSTKTKTDFGAVLLQVGWLLTALCIQRFLCTWWLSPRPALAVLTCYCLFYGSIFSKNRYELLQRCQSSMVNLYGSFRYFVEAVIMVCAFLPGVSPVQWGQWGEETDILYRTIRTAGGFIYEKKAYAPDYCHEYPVGIVFAKYSLITGCILSFMLFLNSVILWNGLNTHQGTQLLTYLSGVLKWFIHSIYISARQLL